MDAYLNGTRTEYDGYVKYSGGPLGGTLYIDQDQAVVTVQRVPGDINGDGAVSTADVVLLARYIKAEGAGVDIVPGSADINGDGTVSTADLVLLARYVKADGQGIVIY